MHAAPAEPDVPLRSVTWPRVVATTLAGLILAVVTALTIPSLAAPAAGSTGRQRYVSPAAPSGAIGRQPTDLAGSYSAPQLGGAPPGADGSDPPSDTTAPTGDPSAPTGTPTPSASDSPSPSGSPTSTSPSPSARRTSTAPSATPAQPRTAGAPPGHGIRNSTSPRRLAEEQPPAGGSGGGVRTSPTPRGSPTPTTKPAPAAPGTTTGNVPAAAPGSGSGGTLTAMSRQLILSGMTGLVIAAVGLSLLFWRRRQW